MMTDTPYLGGRPWPTSSALFAMRNKGQNMVSRHWSGIRTEAFSALVGDILNVTPVSKDTVILEVFTYSDEKNECALDVTVIKLSDEPPEVHAFPGMACVHGYLDAAHHVALEAGTPNQDRAPLLLKCHRCGDFWETTPRALSFREY